MMIKTMFTCALTAAWLVAGALNAPATETDAGRAELQSLSGTYASPAPEPWYGGFGTRRFTFQDGAWGLVFIHALDPEMKVETFRFRTEGPYRIGEASASVAGAFEAVFFEDVKYVTLLTADQAIVEAFGMAGCGLKTGVEIDISATGCAGWKPVSVCREDHDLLSLSADGLHFGVRPQDNDMCAAERRPTALLPAVVKQ
ncbi:MAG: hypothetical protein QE484_12305 [Rhizobium sp.]|nr:hypothetical protein [Rhizobium sp.]